MSHCHWHGRGGGIGECTGNVIHEGTPTWPPHAGDTSPLTKVLRPAVGLTEDECQSARKLRRRGYEIRDDIAARLGASEAQVTQAFATSDAHQKPEASRRSLNVTLAAHRFVADEAEPGEPCWETIDRLFGELANHGMGV